ncbi:hypothetical protein EJ04DRAFT_471576 [Polyplosphaeria fusca]|uniref:PWI domain-containing protein n=1 Tax=Polyplosphaeria fusca TaxID=682080 RepID=A0A9P4QS51_9PLEO|nr:hypothetical protein EJ04DRAFT_471576 [Polyplosphaeria fusca]
MYNYPGAPGAPPGYNRGAPGFGGSPPMGPPGLVPPPGTSTPSAPGVAPSPGSSAGPRGPYGGFQPPTNLPSNINFNAPVIRLGTGPQRGAALDGAAGRRESTAPNKRGLGMDSHMRDADGRNREAPAQLIPPTREEIARTIFVANIAEGVGGDEGVERILRCAGNLVRWIRASDANNKPLTFGFAEYGDAEGLETAAEIFKDVWTPRKLQDPNKIKEEGAEEVEKAQFIVKIDPASRKYAEEWKARRNEDEAEAQFRLDHAKEALASVLQGLFDPRKAPEADVTGDIVMHDVGRQNGDGAEIINIPLSAAAEDELSDIPEEMRATVAKEIAQFRNQSLLRDKERAEQLEAEERRKNGRRSPPFSAPTGPSSSGVNGVPLGPKADRGIQGAPTGPRGSQFPKDYQGGVNFVNGGAMNNGTYIAHDDEDDSASDEELERRRQEKIKAADEVKYQKRLAEFKKHQHRFAAQWKRVQARDAAEAADQKRRREEQAVALLDFSEDSEVTKQQRAFRRDIQAWVRAREPIKAKEDREDEEDRLQEERELAALRKERDAAQEMADNFLDRQAQEMQINKPQPQAPARFKFSLSTAHKKLEQANAVRRAVADVESLLETENLDDAPAQKRTLIPIDDNAPIRNNLTQEEIAYEKKLLASQIPTDKKGLFEWSVSWPHLSAKVINEDIKQWAEKKVLESVGMQEDMLIDAIIDHLKKRGKPEDLVDELTEAIDDEAENLVRKLWRMVIYYSEVEKRGIK